MKKPILPSDRNTSKKPILRSSKLQSPSPVKFTTNTPEKLPQRTRNRGVALSISETRKVAKGLQQDQRRNDETKSSSPVKSARRQISLWPSSSSKPKNTDNDPSKLPEKYKILVLLLHGLVTSISLIRGKGCVPTFTKINSFVRNLTDREFNHGHLAQLKFVLREAIVIKKILLRDKITSFLVPDLQISLNLDGVVDDAAASHSQVRVLKKLFQARVREFWECHPEGDEIPEETLPEPFNRPKKDIVGDVLKTHLPTRLPHSMRHIDIVTNKESSNIGENLSAPVKTSVEQLAGPSHLPPSCRASFSHKLKKNLADVEQKSLLDEKPELPFPVPESSLKENPPPPATTPMSTPAKLVSTPIRLMSATPDLRPSKKHIMSPDDSTTSSLNKLARRPPRSSTRSLFDTPVKNKEAVNEDNDGGLPIDNDVFDILPETLIQSLREKERMAMEERDPAISQAKKRKKNVARLPKLFDMIRVLLRRQNCMTKAELVSKIILNHCDIVDRGEVEEQLNLLQELAPEFISEKLTSSGDLVIRINKMESPETVRASLVEAAK